LLGVLIDKINAHIDLTEDEMIEFKSHETDRMRGHKPGWFAYITSVVKLEGRMYALDWIRGLTEYSEDDVFPYQLYEVIDCDFKNKIYY